MLFKKLFFLLIPLLLFSCNGLSDSKEEVSSIKKQKWNMVSSFPKSLDSFWDRVESFSENVTLLTDQELTIKAYQPNELVPALEVFDAVSNGSVELGVTAGTYFIGKNKAFILEAGIPFGLNARQQNAWLYEYGGLELVQELYKKYDIMYFPIGNTGTQMGGWFHDEIKSLNDIKGLRIRAAGMAGLVYDKMGATIQMVSGGEIYSSLEQGAIDGAEFIGPYDDERFGFQNIVNYYYAPGWGEPGTSIALYINMNKWNSLSEKAKKTIEISAKASNISMLAKYDKENAEAVIRLKKQGVKFMKYSDDILLEAHKQTKLILSDYAKDPDFKKIYESLIEFQNKSNFWISVNELYQMEFDSKIKK